MTSLVVQVTDDHYVVDSDANIEVRSNKATTVYLTSLANSTKKPIHIIKPGHDTKPVFIMSGLISGRSCLLRSKLDAEADSIVIGRRGTSSIKLMFDVEQDLWYEV